MSEQNRERTVADRVIDWVLSFTAGAAALLAVPALLQADLAWLRPTQDVPAARGLALALILLLSACAVRLMASGWRD